MHIDNSSILHVADKAIRYQAAKWLQNVTAKYIWDILRLCLIDAHLSSPNYIYHNVGKNFVSKEFC